MNKNYKILVTGGNGFLGRHVVDELLDRGYKNTYFPKSKELDLLNEDSLTEHFRLNWPDIIIHLAAVVGGIGANKDNPGKFFYENMKMGTNIIHASLGPGFRPIPRKFVFVSTTCAYPKFPPTIPFKESEIWDGYPEETNAPYGVAKKSLMVMGNAYREQYGLNFITLIPTNMYGEHDNFDPESSHVIPAVIRKFDEAIKNNEDSVTFWGDGSPSRDFIYVKDSAKLIVDAALNYDEPEPINLGSGIEYKIKDIVEIIGSFMGYEGDIIWDTSKPNGQPRRALDISYGESKLGKFNLTPFPSGIENTIKYWRSICSDTHISTKNN